MNIVQWTQFCHGCGEARGCWAQHAKPNSDLFPCDCGAALDDSEWQRIETGYAYGSRRSGYSTSESDFRPHYNPSFGCEVESLSHLRKLQRATGAQDAVVTGDASRFVPRDLDSKASYYDKIRETGAGPGAHWESESA